MAKSSHDCSYDVALPFPTIDSPCGENARLFSPPRNLDFLSPLPLLASCSLPSGKSTARRSQPSLTSARFGALQAPPSLRPLLKKFFPHRPSFFLWVRGSLDPLLQRTHERSSWVFQEHPSLSWRTLGCLLSVENFGSPIEASR